MTKVLYHGAGRLAGREAALAGDDPDRPPRCHRATSPSDDPIRSILSPCTIISSWGVRHLPTGPPLYLLRVPVLTDAAR